MQAAGEDIGDMFEISTVRREDWDFCQVIIMRMRRMLTVIEEGMGVYPGLIKIRPVSMIKGYDICFLQDKSGEFVSVLQCNNAPSSRTPRGHQFPAAFMMQVLSHQSSFFAH